MSARTRQCYAARVQAMPPALTLQQLKGLEASFAGDSDEAVVRYTALLTLAAPAAVVFDAISTDRSTAVIFAQLAQKSRDYIDFLARIQRALAQSARRIEAALEQRVDADDVVREAKNALADAEAVS